MAAGHRCGEDEVIADSASISTVLCGVDVSPAATAAAHWAVHLTSRTEGDLVLLHAFRRPPVAAGYLHTRPGAVPAPAAGLRAEVEATEAAVVERLAAGLGSARPRTLTREGDPAVELLTTAQTEDADLLVLGSRLSSAVLGSVSSDVVRGSDRPVLIVGANHSPPAGTGTAVLAGLDPEHEPGRVAQDAAAMATALGADLVLCHVAQESPTLISLLAGGSADRVESVPSPDGEHRWLRRIAEDAEAGGVRVHAIVRYGEPARELLEFAARHSAAVLAVGSHRRGALGSAVVGSTSSTVLRAAILPVLIASPG